MFQYTEKGMELRNVTMEIVLDYMKSNEACGCKGSGIRAAELFRVCGFGWGDQTNATSSSQQYWIVALLRYLESLDRVERDDTTKRWRLK